MKGSTASRSIKCKCTHHCRRQVHIGIGNATLRRRAVRTRRDDTSSQFWLVSLLLLLLFPAFLTIAGQMPCGILFLEHAPSLQLVIAPPPVLSPSQPVPVPKRDLHAVLFGSKVAEYHEDRRDVSDGSIGGADAVDRQGVREGDAVGVESEQEGLSKGRQKDVSVEPIRGLRLYLTELGSDLKMR